MGLLDCLCGRPDTPNPGRAYLPGSPTANVTASHDKTEWLKEEREHRARVQEAERDGVSDSEGEGSRQFVDRHASNVEETASARRILREQPTDDPSMRTLPGEEYRRWDDHPVRNDYLILSSLGRGAFAEVALGMHKQTGKRAALKVVFLNKPGLKEKHLAILQREGNYLMKMAHRNIVKCSKIYRAPNQWVFVMEHLKGGMLLNDLAKLKRYSERIAAVVFKQLLRATEYLHDNKIVHRDIKPENVVFRHSLAGSHNLHHSKSNVVKLVDFGMVLDLRKEPTARGMMGSPGFVAPEVILGGYHTTQMDMYSLGVLLFVMLVGAKPMTQDQAKSMQYAVLPLESLRGVLDSRWRVLTDAAKDMVANLLHLDPKLRLTAKQALNHPWLKAAKEESVIDGSVMEGWADPNQHLHAAAFMGNPFAHHMARSPMGMNHAGLMSMQSPHAGGTPMAMTHTPRQSTPRGGGGGGHTPHGRSGPFSNMHLLQSPLSNNGHQNNPFDQNSSVSQAALHSMRSLPGHSMPLSSHHRSMINYEPTATTTQWTNPENTSGFSPGPHGLASGPLNSQLSGVPGSALHQADRASSLQGLNSYGNPLNRAVAQAAHDQAIKKAQEAHAQVQRYLMTAQAIASHPSAFASPHAYHHLSAPMQMYDKMDSPGSQNVTPVDNSCVPSALAAHINSGHTSTHFTQAGSACDESCNLSEHPSVQPSGYNALAPKHSGNGEMVMSTAKIMDDAHNLMEELRQAPSLSANGDLEAQLRLATQHMAAVQLVQHQQVGQNSMPVDNLRTLAALSHQQSQAPRSRSGQIQYSTATPPVSTDGYRKSVVPADRIAMSLPALKSTDLDTTHSMHGNTGQASNESDHSSMHGNPANHPFSGDHPHSLPSGSRTRSTNWRKSKTVAKPSPAGVSILTKEIPRDLARDAYYSSGAHSALPDALKSRGVARSPLPDRTPNSGRHSGMRRHANSSPGLLSDGTEGK